jgi:CDP-diacylglycerol--glycerol-3-phosphate 3-phosphatidyltransferase
MLSKGKNSELNLPNLLTLMRILVIPLVCYLLLLGTPMSGVICALLFGLAAVTDLLDGYLARKLNLESITGKFLDPLADKLFVMSVLVCLVSMGRMASWLVILVISRELYINALRTIASAEGIIISAGKTGKLKTAFQLTGLSGLLAHYQYIIDFGFFTSTVRFHQVGMLLFLISVGFSLLSAYRYTRNFYRNLWSAA